MPNDLAQKIRHLRLSLGLTLEDVASQVGVGKSTVRKWETGMIENMRRDKIASLAAALHTTPGYLMGWDDDTFRIRLTSDQQAKVIELLDQARSEKNLTEGFVTTQSGISPQFFLKLRKPQSCLVLQDELKAVSSLLGVEDAVAAIIDNPFPDSVQPVYGMHRIPILGRISAGLPLFAEEHIEGYTYTDLNGGAEYFALRVQGDSMSAARILDGDTLIIRRQDVVENGQIAVVLVGEDEATVKRFYQIGNNVTLMPQSTNPDHQPQTYDIRNNSVRIIGLVVKNEITF